MIKKILTIISLLIISSTIIKAQNMYSTTGGEWIFSLANVEYGSEATGDATTGNDILRWSPLINVYNYWHYDVNNNLGFMLGLGTHNLGFITDVPTSVVEGSSGLNYNGDMRKKFRTYTLGIPVGVKVGIMKEMYLYGGYEIEFPYAYKEKTIEDGHKVHKYTDWFSSHTPVLYNSLFVGVQFRSGTSLKFHYYLDDFFDQDYVQGLTETNAQNFYPTQANMFYFSMSQTIFRGGKVLKPSPSPNNHHNARVAFNMK